MNYMFIYRAASSSGQFILKKKENSRKKNKVDLFTVDRGLIMRAFVI